MRICNLRIWAPAAIVTFFFITSSWVRKEELGYIMLRLNCNKHITRSYDKIKRINNKLSFYEQPLSCKQ